MIESWYHHKDVSYQVPTVILRNATKAQIRAVHRKHPEALLFVFVTTSVRTALDYSWLATSGIYCLPFYIGNLRPRAQAMRAIVAAVTGAPNKEALQCG